MVYGIWCGMLYGICYGILYGIWRGMEHGSDFCLVFAVLSVYKLVSKTLLKQLNSIRNRGKRRERGTGHSGYKCMFFWGGQQVGGRGRLTAARVRLRVSALNFNRIELALFLSLSPI